MTEEGGNRARGNARARGKGHPGDRVHAYATISFDYIIAFRPGGIIRVNKLHISFHPAPPLPPLSLSLSLSRCVILLSRFCRRANSRRLFDLADSPPSGGCRRARVRSAG